MNLSERRARPERRPPHDPSSAPAGRYSAQPVNGKKKKQDPFSGIVTPEEEESQ